MSKNNVVTFTTKQGTINMTAERVRNKVYVVTAQIGDIKKEAILIIPKIKESEEFKKRAEMTALEITLKGIEVDKKMVYEAIKKESLIISSNIPRWED